MNMRLVISIVMAMILFSPGLSAAADIIIIANKDVAGSTLSVQDVKNIFLGKKTTWNDNSKIIFVIQKKTDAHELFLKEYINKSDSQFSNYWRKRVFTGKGSPPKSFSSERDLVQFVAQTGGAVGYVASRGGLNNVKIISTK